MKHLHASFLLALGLAFAASAGAQTPAATPSSGLLGKRYVEASTFLIDYHNAPDAGYGVGTAVNVPLNAHFDVGASFLHTWEEGDATENFQDLAVSLTAYAAHGNFRPFAKASLGYEWWYVSDDPFYQIDVGTEYLVTDRFSVSAQLSWSEFLATDWNGGMFSGSTRANYWVTADIATSVNVTYTEGGTWTYGLAAVFQF
ncbi:MAG: hypothetical protein K0R17_443 [Rariglobus sp.]|jgi:hypothetical protein|nr:hypothetical protein [Rariglobus sp.]